mmetsp:Transcript_24971/g.41621  ORF Transcript_24971/g.41621 Transcript_24971/m.41621 type:complete len:264 (-) Transcript_24971:252-1043(-)
MQITIAFVLFFACIEYAEALKAILLSRLSAVDSPEFRSIVSSLNEPNRGQLLYVPTAQYVLDPNGSKSMGEQRRRARYDAKQKAKLLCDAFSIDDYQVLELDANDISRDSIQHALSKSSILYVDGGNTFYLQKYLLETNFWSLATPCLLTGNCVYMGASAGCIVVGKSIKMTYWKGWDDPLAAGSDYIWSEKRLEGANLFKDASFFMHYDSEIHASLVEKNQPNFGHPVRLVGDNAALVYDTSVEAASSAEPREYVNDGVVDQ